MAIIGSFKKSEKGYTGEIATLTLKAKVEFVPVEAKSEKSPAYKVMAGKLEIGAAWEKTAADTSKPYLSVKLDDPTFAAPIWCALFEGEKGSVLVWDRQ